MKQLDKITSSSKQNFKVSTETGEQVEFYLQYNPSQECWNISFSYEDFIMNGLQLCVNPNMLRQYRNLLPFGLAVGSIDGLDPRYITDFVSNRIGLFLLNAAEVEAVEGSFAA